MTDRNRCMQMECLLRVIFVYLKSVPLGCCGSAPLLTFLRVFLVGAPRFLQIVSTRWYSPLEHPLFLRMSSGVVPKTNLTFCSTPCGQRTRTVKCWEWGWGSLSHSTWKSMWWVLQKFKRTALGSPCQQFRQAYIAKQLQNPNCVFCPLEHFYKESGYRAA